MIGDVSMIETNMRQSDPNRINNAYHETMQEEVTIAVFSNYVSTNNTNN